MDIPTDVRLTLTASFFAYEADQAIQGGARRDSFGHVGDPVGKVIQWLWHGPDPTDATAAFAGYLSYLRKWNPAAPKPEITLEDALGALRFAWTDGMDEYQRFCERARDEVPQFYGASVS